MFFWPIYDHKLRIYITMYNFPVSATLASLFLTVKRLKGDTTESQIADRQCDQIWRFFGLWATF